MNGRETGSDRRGGGDRTRTDDFRFAPGGRGMLAFASVGVLGLVAVLAAVLDLGGAQARGQAVWLAPAGGFLILTATGLAWLTRRRPVLLRVGPEGLDLPAAFSRPLAWADIWRIRLARRKVLLQPEFVLLRVDLARGVRPPYGQRPWVWPRADAWIARKFGLRVPIHNLDAASGAVLASVERFKPVQRDAP